MVGSEAVAAAGRAASTSDAGTSSSGAVWASTNLVMLLQLQVLGLLLLVADSDSDCEASIAAFSDGEASIAAFHCQVHTKLTRPQKNPRKCGGATKFYFA